MGDPIIAIMRIAEYVRSLEGLLEAVLFAVGAVLCVQSLILVARRAEAGPQAVSLARCIIAFLSGTMLIAFPQTVSVVLGTLFGSMEEGSSESLFSYGGGVFDPLAHSRPMVEAVIGIIRFIGLIAIGRGILFFSRASAPGGPATLGPGFTFIIAGALAVNFPVFIGLLGDLFMPGPESASDGPSRRRT